MSFTEFILRHGCNAGEIRELRLHLAFLRMKQLLTGFLK